MNTKKHLYPNLIAEMARNGEGIKHLALILDTNKYSVSNKLNGKTRWTIDDVDKLCKHYTCDFYYLFERKDN